MKYIAKFIYYILNLTWGGIMTLVGYAAALGLLISGHKPAWNGPCLHFKVGRNWGGVSLGLVTITDDTPTAEILHHEFGHTLQNAILGPLFIFLVAIPSGIRYQMFEYRWRHNKPNPDYDSIWFEGTATKYGTKYFDVFK